MKNITWTLLMMFCSFMADAGAKDFESLPEHKLGAVRYFLDEVEQTVWLEGPLKAEMGWVETDPDNYLLSIEVTMLSPWSHPDGIAVREQFAGWKVQSLDADARWANISIRVLRNIEMDVQLPPSRQVMATAYANLSKAQLDELRSEVKSGIYPTIHATLRRLTPQVSSTERLSVAVGSLCNEAADRLSVTKEIPSTKAIAQISSAFFRRHKSFQYSLTLENAIERILKRCVQVQFSRPVVQLKDLQDVLVDVIRPPRTETLEIVQREFKFGPRVSQAHVIWKSSGSGQ